MKKNVISALAVLTAASLLTGCSSQTTYGKYMKLGQYKGLELTKIVSEITDEDVDYEIEFALEENSEYTDVDRGAKDGDQVNIDFEGTIDGEEFEGGTESDYDLILGSEDFDSSFEEALIGAKAGDILEIPLTFSDEYDEELAGKEAVYSVTVNSVQEIHVPELTDEYCKEYTDYQTVEEYRAGIRQELEAYAESNNLYTTGNDAITQILDTTEFSGYPQELYDECKASYDANNEAMAEMFGMEPEELASEEDSESAILEMVHSHMAVVEIAEKEKITVSDEEYKEYLNTSYEDYDYDSPEEFEKDYTKETLTYDILFEKVAAFLLENGKVTEVTEDEYYSDEDYDFEMDDEELESEDMEVDFDAETPSEETDSETTSEE